MAHMQVAFDAIAPNSGRIPVSPAPFAVGGYVNGANRSFIWSAAEWNRFPGSYHIRINVTGDPARGDCLDVETFDATPADVQPWIETRAPNTPKPLIVYCNRSNLDACVAARNAAQRATGRYAFIWCATLDGTLSGRAMTQLTQVSDTHTRGAFADLSVIQDERLLEAMAANLG